MTRRGAFFSGPKGLLIYMTRPGYFYALESRGPRALSEDEVRDLVREELLTEQPYEVHEKAVAAERLAMVLPPHPEVDPYDPVREALDAERRRRRMN